MPLEQSGQKRLEWNIIVWRTFNQWPCKKWEFHSVLSVHTLTLLNDYNNMTYGFDQDRGPFHPQRNPITSLGQRSCCFVQRAWLSSPNKSSTRSPIKGGWQESLKFTMSAVRYKVSCWLQNFRCRSANRAMFSWSPSALWHFALFAWKIFYVSLQPFLQRNYVQCGHRFLDIVSIQFCSGRYIITGF